MIATNSNPGRLPSEIAYLRPNHTITLPPQLMLALQIEPYDYIQELPGNGKTVILKKYTGAEPKYCPRRNEIAPVLRVGQQRRVSLSSIFCRTLGLADNDALILYLDEANQRLILQKYDVINDAVTQIESVYKTMQHAAAESLLPLGECHAVMQSLETAKSRLLLINNSKKKQTTKLVV